MIIASVNDPIVNANISVRAVVSSNDARIHFFVLYLSAITPPGMYRIMFPIVYAVVRRPICVFEMPIAAICQS